MQRSEENPAMTSRELTPTEENITNSMNDTVNLAINKVMGQDAQSYEDFVGGFQHITKETVTHQKKSTTLSKPSQNKSSIIGHQQGVGQTNKDNTEQDVKQSDKTADEELEEEVLESGTTVTSVTDCTPRVKFDNFVDEDMLEEETSGYTASFGNETKEKSELTTTEGSQQLDKEKKIYKTDALAVSHVHNDLLQIPVIDTNLNTDITSERDEPDTTSEVLTDYKASNVVDSLENTDVNDTSNTCDIHAETGNKQIELYPGEAEPEEKEVHRWEITNHTKLDFSAVTSKSNEFCGESNQVCSESTDEVQPFSLDDDFDYDNVVLTPKFTIEEVEHLKSFLPKNDLRI